MESAQFQVIQLRDMTPCFTHSAVNVRMTRVLQFKPSSHIKIDFSDHLEHATGQKVKQRERRTFLIFYPANTEGWKL